MDNKQIGCYLLNKRKELGKTQKEIAEQFGVTYQAVSRWENGDSIPDIETLCMIADFYKVSVDEILQRKRGYQPEEMEFNPSKLMWLMFMITVSSYLLGYITHLTLDYYNLTMIGYVCFVMFAILGVITINAYFLTFSFYEEGFEKTKKDYIYYIGSYVPLVVFAILILI